MPLDKHVLQQWIAGAEIRFRKTRKPLSKMAAIRFLNSVADATQDYVVTERIDLTKARDFQAQETSEDILVASMQIPIFGKRTIGNDSGLAVAASNTPTKTATNTTSSPSAHTLSAELWARRASSDK